MTTSLYGGALGALFALALQGQAHAQDGAFLTNWANGGRTTLALDTQHWDTHHGLAVQTGGKPVLVGTCTNANNIQALCLTRLLPDGTFDTNFGEVGNGRVLFAGDPRFPRDSSLGDNGFARQADNRLVMATFSYLSSDGSGPSFEGRLLRLSANGMPQPFGDGSLYKPVAFADNVAPSAMNNSPQAVAVAASGKIVVAGNTSRAGQPYSNLDWGIERFNADLSVDTGFNTTGRKVIAFDVGGGMDDAAKAVAVQADNKIVVAGTVPVDANTRNAAVVRLNADGSFDTTFGTGGRIRFGDAANAFSVNAMALDAQGRIVVAGSILYNAAAHQPMGFFVARLTANGQLDTRFGDPAMSFAGSDSADTPIPRSGVAVVYFGLTYPSREIAFGLALQGDKIIAMGSATRYFSTIGGSDWYGDDTFALARLKSDGTLDSNFGSHGRLTGSFISGTSTDVARHAAVDGAALFVSGDNTPNGDFTPVFGLARLRLDTVFHDGFDP